MTVLPRKQLGTSAPVSFRAVLSGSTVIVEPLHPSPAYEVISPRSTTLLLTPNAYAPAARSSPSVTMNPPLRLFVLLPRIWRRRAPDFSSMSPSFAHTVVTSLCLSPPSTVSNAVLPAPRKSSVLTRSALFSFVSRYSSAPFVTVTEAIVAVLGWV